jgi:lipid II:glycine glycyltransferase (peptidoglycan interpeptide bridge formation enzyme)
MFRALGADGAVGAHLWIVEGDVAYSHLAAFSETGYATGAAYALYWEAIRTFRERFADRVRWVDLGAGAGSDSDATDGLTKFKRGWTRLTRTKHFCGRVFDRAAYGELAAARGAEAAAYFPAYRFGEF